MMGSRLGRRSRITTGLSVMNSPEYSIHCFAGTDVDQPLHLRLYQFAAPPFPLLNYDYYYSVFYFSGIFTVLLSWYVPVLYNLTYLQPDLFC
jgi:hypothetical protein